MTRIFDDNNNRRWHVSVNVASIKRVKALLGVDLLAITDGNLLERIIGDPVQLCDILYALCQPQAQLDEVTDEQFGQGLCGDSIEHATTALLESLADFFPSGKRQVLHKALAKIREVEAKAIELANQKLDSAELTQRMESLLAAPGA
mgnify:CR=1 FL=1